MVDLFFILRRLLLLNIGSHDKECYPIKEFDEVADLVYKHGEKGCLVHLETGQPQGVET